MSIVRIFGLTAIGVMWFAPILWVFFVSLGSDQGYVNILSDVGSFGWQNYEYLLNHGQFTPILSSIIVAFLTALFVVPIAYLVSFEQVASNSKVASAVFWTTLVYKLVPASAVALAAYGLMVVVGLAPSVILAAILVSISSCFFAILFFNVALRNLPNGIVDAMRIDGLSGLRIRLDLATSLLATDVLGMFVLYFLIGWGEAFLTALFTPYTARPVAAEMFTFVTPFGIYWGLLSSLIVVGILPCLIVGTGVMGLVLRRSGLSRSQ